MIEDKQDAWEELIKLSMANPIVHAALYRYFSFEEELRPSKEDILVSLIKILVEHSDKLTAELIKVKSEAPPPIIIIKSK